MQKHGFIAGAGIAGLSAAIGLARAGWSAQVFEKSSEFGEVGAGVQLGPNVTRLLDTWGLSDALKANACFPAYLRSRRLQDGHVLASMPLGEDMQRRYGAPYVTIHRADLHALLFAAAREAGAGIHCDMPVEQIQRLTDELQMELVIAGQPHTQYAALAVIADGIWSQLRTQILQDEPPRWTGHVAYRTLIKQTDLPLALRSQDVTVWMGPDAHVVQYPVKAGEWLNVVCLVEGPIEHLSLSDRQSWDTPAAQAQTQAALAKAMQSGCAPLRDLLAACASWRMWPLYGRGLMQGPHQHAQGRMVLVGDAAHPMLPYLAQGAGMAIEDAHQLEAVLKSASPRTVAHALEVFAQARWQRNARVQARAARQGQIFHATGALGWARDQGLRLLGARLMDLPWLYGASSDNGGK